MPNREHQRWTRWVGFFIVALDVYNAPRATRGIIQMCREDHRMIIAVVFIVPLAIAFNGALLANWWKYRPSNPDNHG